MTGWRTVELGAALELVYGKALPRSTRVEAGRVPVYGSNGVAGWHDQPLVVEPTVIVGRKGSAGAVQYVDEPCYPIDTTYFVRARPGYEYDMKFLFYLLRQLDLPRLKTATGVPGLTREDAYRERVPVPPIGEQRRIVDLLSRAEGIIRLRRQAQQKAAQLIPAIFAETFGDPATNPKGWPVVNLGDLLAEPPTLGTMAKPSATTGAWLDLRVANIQGGKLDLRDKKWLDLPDQQVERFTLRAGDILLARAIGSLDHLGKAVIVDPPTPWTFDSHLMRLRLTASKMLPEVFKAFLESKSGREAFLKHTRRSAVQFNINGKEVRQISIPLPPLSLQNEFVARCQAVAGISDLQASAADRASATFQALLSRAFSGDRPDLVTRAEEV